MAARTTFAACLLTLVASVMVQQTSIVRPSEEMIDTFGAWVQDHDTLRTIRAALQAGRPVLVPSAYRPEVFEALRAEFTAAEYTRSDRATPEEKMRQLEAAPFFGSDVCHAVDAMNGGELRQQHRGDFFFSHQRPASYVNFTAAQRLSTMLGSTEVSSWISWLLGDLAGEESSVGSATFGVRRFDQGDAYGSHNDETDGRLGGLSFTSYLTAPGEEWAADWGGNFVWCADPSSPVYISPAANTLLLFRVELTSWHHVQPLMPGAPPRYVFQGWWRLQPAAAKAYRSSYASEQTAAPRDRSLVLVLEIEPLEKSCAAD